MSGARASDLTGRVVLVTGSAAGIGAACTEVLAGYGAAIAVLDLAQDAADAQAERLAGLGADAAGFAADVADPDAVDAAVDAILARFGRLDAAVNNAGISGLVAPIAEYGADEWRAVIDINLNGVFFCTRAEIRAMRERGGGSIVNISSILGMAGTTGSPAYTAAKHGVVGLTRCAAIEYAQEGIRANAIGPGRILTPMLERNLDEEGLAAKAALAPMNRLGKPSEIGEAVAWLCSDASSFVTGAYLPVDGGFLAA